MAGFWKKMSCLYGRGYAAAAALAALLLLLASIGLSAAGTKSLVRISFSSPEELKHLPRGLDVAGRSPEGWIEVVAGAEEVERIRAAGLSAEIIHPDVEAYAASMKGVYRTFDQLVSDLEIYTTVFSSISQMDTIGWTCEGRPLMVVKISDNVTVDEPDEPELFFMGLHHAREWPSLEIVYFIIDSLLTTYGFDSHITDLVNTRQIWLMPCVNPDGYVYCHDEGHDWRKNRRFLQQYNSYGVDLNRNYNGTSNGVSLGAWGTTTTYGTSHDPWDGAYCGPFPFSEAEVQAVRDLFLSRRFVFSVSYHTYMEGVIWPWGYSSEVTVPDNGLISAVGQEMASRITRQSGSGTYTAAQSPAIGYTTTGDSDDWAYSCYHYVLGSNCLPYTVEACSQFHPPEVSLDQVVRENFDGAIYLCEIADSVAVLLSPRVIPVVLAPLGTLSGGDFIVSWSIRNAPALPDLFELQELSGLSVVTDDGEGGGWRWDLQGFTLGSSRSHSSGHSYRSSSQDGAADAMTTIDPYPVCPGDSLTFWCWYNIEAPWDMAYVEVSVDGRDFRLLDSTATFQGSSAGWMRRAYSLEDYAGLSVYFRFRYTTDGENQLDGFYVDDIHPAASFSSAVSLSAGITDTCYAISGQEPGDYYYRVRGHNAARGWGDWSCCRLATIIEGSIPPQRISDLKAVPAGGLCLSWSPVTVDTAGSPLEVHHYVIYRDTIPDFAASEANSLAATIGCRYDDLTAAVGLSGVNHYYLLRAVHVSGSKSEDSNRVGEFDRYIQRWK